MSQMNYNPNMTAHEMAEAEALYWYMRSVITKLQTMPEHEKKAYAERLLSMAGMLP